MKKIFNFLNNSKLFPFYIVTPIPYALGTASENIRIALAKAMQKKKFLLIIVPKIGFRILNYHICNKYLFEDLIINGHLQHQFKLRYLINFLLNFIFVIKRSAALFIKYVLKIRLSDNYFFLEIGINDDDFDNKLNKDPDKISKILPYNFSYIKNDTIKLQQKDKFLSDKVFLSLKIDKNQDFICLHVRDSSYRNDLGKRNFRNSNVANYYELMEFLIKKDIVIFRMGINAEKKIDLKNKNIIDLPFLDINYDFFNLHLIKECKFFIGTQSGPLDTAMLLNKSCLITNVLRVFNAIPNTSRSRVLCKIPFVKKTKEIMNLNQYLKLPFAFHHPNFINDDLDFVENTSEELFIAIKDYLTLFNSTKNTKIILKKNQIIFNNFILDRFSEMLAENDKDLIKYDQKIRSLRVLKSIEGSYCPTFLNKYFNEKNL